MIATESCPLTRRLEVQIRAAITKTYTQAYHDVDLILYYSEKHRSSIHAVYTLVTEPGYCTNVLLIQQLPTNNLNVRQFAKSKLWGVVG